ncbi:hypothetical protein [Streptomyces sp. URMC 129]|uniref:hypothetical protein n=1 Tax=Streptomyces sp. URMC 129 TaxID=3423407 RepID=UPI003F1DB0FD
MTVLLLALTAGALLGYIAGRTRPGQAAMRWAEDAVCRGWRRPTSWAAAVVLLVAIAWQVTVHPIQSAENRRSWREGKERAAHRSPPVGIPDTPQPDYGEIVWRRTHLGGMEWAASCDGPCGGWASLGHDTALLASAALARHLREAHPAPEHLEQPHV